MTPARRTATWLLLMVIGALVCYITIDITQDGRLDGTVHGYLSAGSPP